MTDPTNLDDVIVTGQRRENGSMAPFPQRPSFTPPNPGDVSEIEPDIGEGQEDPCNDPVKQREWELDAAAAEAVKEFLRRANLAGENGLNYRERGAFLYRKTDGTVGIGPIAQSDPYHTGQVHTDLLLGDFTEAQVIGSVHSHPPGAHLPSQTSPALPLSDMSQLESMRMVMEYNNPGSGHLARLYIAATTLANGNVKINIYTPGTAAGAANGQVGPEVNPDGQPCSGLLTP